MSRSVEQPLLGLDVLRLPLLGRLLRHRYGRLALQAPLTLAALALIIDGFVGPQSAARNLATVAPWVHYRGLVVLALLLAGNLFCMGCPFTLPRSLAKRLSRSGRRFPQRLRNKWLALFSLFALFFFYEYLDLWASPALTAWLIVAYFLASFVLEAVFRESAFCKYVCPLGSFNMVYSTLSPTRIAVKSPSVCATCVGKECVNGSYAPQTVIRIDEIPTGAGAAAQRKEIRHGPSGALGCGTELFAPQLRSNLDCTMCLDCVRACPHDNASLFTRAPGVELRRPDTWPRSWHISLLVIALCFMGISNAFGMVPPYYALQETLATQLSLSSEFLVLLLIFWQRQFAAAACSGLSSRWFEPAPGRGAKTRFFTRYSRRLRACLCAAWLWHLVRPLQLSFPSRPGLDCASAARVSWAAAALGKAGASALMRTLSASFSCWCCWVAFSGVCGWRSWPRCGSIAAGLC